MKMLPIIVAAGLALGASISGVAADTSLLQPSAWTTEGHATSNRTPDRRTEIPVAQIDTTKDGQTSDRTPHKGSDGAASGEQGTEAGSKSKMEALDETYRSDKAQEKELRAGGKAN